jgi:hypothetical protein
MAVSQSVSQVWLQTRTRHDVRANQTHQDQIRRPQKKKKIFTKNASTSCGPNNQPPAERNSDKCCCPLVLKGESRRQQQVEAGQVILPAVAAAPHVSSLFSAHKTGESVTRFRPPRVRSSQPAVHQSIDQTLKETTAPRAA